ncbi:MAG: recombination regulator RecX [Oscillospiraceae bacterium]|nr:recombination regulator RecX [Oscillospiraceae bacterium]MCL2278573.1 recombination regulator RecX [Oscillospiraceae bacterium]
MTDNLENTKKRALKILGNRNFSEAEMIKRLTSKGESLEDAEETAAWLVELGYISDENYASLIVEHYSSKGYGITRVKDELYKRGVPRELWDSALFALDDESVSEAVSRFLTKKLRGSRDEDDVRKARDALVRRGFSYEDAKMAINLYLESV